MAGASSTRTVRLKTLAKLNIGLKVLDRRPDGYHELRTVYQTVSLADTLEVEFTRTRHTTLHIDSSVDIQDNLVVRAANLVLEALRVQATVRFHLHKRIPLGAGLGGGSSDAASVLLALPALAGKPIALNRLMELGACLGSDVPFFLLGGTALGLGRGEEVYPLPDLARARGLIVAPEIHVSTADAYRALNRPVTGLTSPRECRIINSFQSLVWSLSGSSPVGEPVICENDFEEVVFARHPRLKAIKSKLLRLGACPAMLTGSGAALFGLFQDSDQWKSAAAAMGGLRIFPVSLISRPAYRSMWWKQLRAYVAEGLWPPRGPFVE